MKNHLVKIGNAYIDATHVRALHISPENENQTIIFRLGTAELHIDEVAAMS